MGIVYLVALIIGVGTIALQLLMSGDSDSGGADAHVDADTHLDVEADAHVDADHAGHGGHGDGGFLPIFLSLRFWTFALLAFGLSGALIHYLDLVSRGLVPAIAAAMGLACGLLASFTFRALSRAEVSSAGSATDAVGQVGRVLVPLGKGSRGKVRIEVKGQTVDLIATTDDERLDAGQSVLIEELRETTAHVSSAPREVLPPKRES